jgi:hypothetical protein
MARILFMLVMVPAVTDLCLLLSSRTVMTSFDWLQVLTHVTTEFQRTADHCVEAPKSLPVLFGIFMGRNKTAGVKPRSDDAKVQLEGVISIIANLMHYTKKCASHCYTLT